MFDIIGLKNGSKVVLTNISQVRSLSIGVWVKAGTVYESGFPNGIAHFVEHMLFKGTEKRDSIDIAKEIEDIGGDINAFTSREYTCYHTRSLDEYADKCLNILSDIYFNSRISEAEIEKEKNVIKQEISMYEDTPDDLIHDLIIQKMWSKSPYGNPVSGTRESVGMITRTDIIDFMGKFYTPENTVISIAGNFDKDLMLEQIEKLFVFKKCVFSPNASEINLYTPDIYYRDKDTEQNHICIGFKGYDVFDDKNYDIACFNSLFGNGMSSVLFQRIREEIGLVYSIFSYNQSFVGGGSLIIYAGLDRDNTDLYFSEFDSTLKKFMSQKISDDELKIVKNKLRSGFILALESPSSIMNYMGSSEIVKGYINSIEDISNKIEKITLDSMYFNVENCIKNKRSIVLIGKYNGSLSNFA
jgi:predicted Zn-dependent peptidase